MKPALIGSPDAKGLEMALFDRKYKTMHLLHHWQVTKSPPPSFIAGQKNRALLALLAGNQVTPPSVIAGQKKVPLLR